jgi:hypothetical protein
MGEKEGKRKKKIYEIELTSERAYDALKIPWYFEDIRPLNHPARDCAIYVIHGIGNQLYTETAKELRDGFEDALYNIRKWKREKMGKEMEPIPPPFIYEGYWANYSDIEATFPELWRKFSKNERKFFSSLVKHRTTDTWTTTKWFLGQIIHLIHFNTIKQFGWISGGSIIAITPLTILVVLLMLLFQRKFISDVLSDIKIYCDPVGSMERAIVQRIDYHIGEQLLRLLGLDWDFKPLPETKLIKICTKPHTFKYVTVIAHSLGTIITYNVISDILNRVDQYEKEIERTRKTHPLQKKDLSLIKNIERVKTGLHRFYTWGSPLHNIFLLFPNRIRVWSQETQDTFITKNVGKTSDSIRKWANFVHPFDPICEKLGRIFPDARNFYCRTFNFPGGAHSSYFKDPDLLMYIISRTYGPDLCKWAESKFSNSTKFLLLRGLLAILLLIPIPLIFLVFITYPFVWLIKKIIEWTKNLQKKDNTSKNKTD